MEKCGSDGEAEDTLACRMYIACRGSRTKCHRTKCHRNNRGQNIMRTKCYWSKCRDILSTTFCPQHIVTICCGHHYVDKMPLTISLSTAFYPPHFVRDILSGHPCCYTAALQPARQKWGYVQSQNRNFKQCMIACKNCVWLVGWFAVGRIYALSVVGFIASRSDGWFVCWYLSFGRIYGRWLACRFICYPVCRSVEPSGRLAISNLSPTDQPIIHPSI